MISRLRGSILEVTPPTLVLDVAGVGYDVQVPDAVLIQLSRAEGPVEVFVRQIFREDSVTLYGFASPDQRRTFDLLTTVTGCGPRIAMAALSALGEDGIAHAILTGDARALQRTPGIGVKLAERLALELRDKFKEEELVRKVGAAKPVAPAAEPADELIDALLALGYRRAEADAAAKAAREESPDLPDQIRIALRGLRK